ncbi:PREDICTED: uncharacterized protein LOC107189957 [Dufourea novaeangliae]|uniref:uncharacterized protein LOC107189957 n=1 Tax=Dufourea novaeangliae TaxID=178035 RepID=UPI000767035D|nr:PREDICTED: uncharacterized protein LOC107189957 [Dufourea novaeangliae]
METEEVYSLAISPPIVSRFAVQWSDDNHISVLTEKGIHTFEFIPTPMSPYSTIKFSRSFIYVPLIFPVEVIMNKIESKIWNMHREAVYSFIMEEGLTPKISNVKEMIPKIVDLAWSPQNIISPNNCLLAIVTSTGAVIIVHKIATDWYPAYDLCSIRYNAVEAEITTKLKDTKSDLVSFMTLKNCIKTLQASCMAWSMLLADFAYLAVAYQNGDIIIYKIPTILHCSEIPDSKIVGTIHLNECIKINALHWISIDAKRYVIIVAYFDGRIHGLTIEDCEQVIELKSVDKYYDYVDRISVSAIRTFPQNGTSIKILISKGSFLFLLHLTNEGTLKTMQHLQLEGFMISGLTFTSVDYALVTTENNSMFAIDLQENKFLNIKVKNVLQQAQVRYLGLAHSLSYVIFVTVTSPNTVYDHLITKEPSKVHFFALKNKNWDPTFILSKSKGERFEYLWDCLEIIRIKATKAVDPATVLPKVPSNLELLSLNELRLAMWTSVMMKICEKKKVIDGIGSIAGEISEAQPLIFVHTACNYLEHLENHVPLSQEQELSVHLLKMYFEVYLAGEENEEVTPLSKRVRDIVNKTSQYDRSKIESCNLCGEVIHDLSWKVVKCSQGHILPRCAITLLQITSMQYRICQICGLMFHPCLDQVFDKTRCLFCDVPAHQENRVLGSKSFVALENSLSKRTNYVSETPEDRETEAAVDEP